MNRAEFIRELEYLLQDLPEADREDAIAYYRDYLEEAGEEGEAQVLQEFGSPERVAAIIRSDLNGGLENGGEFTESGYQDERFRDPNFQVMKRRELPEVREDAEESRNGDFHTGRKAAGRRQNPFRQVRDEGRLRRLIKVGLLLALLAFLAPIAMGIGSSVLGVLAGIACLLIALLIGIGVLTAVTCIAAVVCLVMGMWGLFVSFAPGLLVLGIGVFLLGAGMIGIAVSVMVYGEFLPYMIRSLVNLAGRFFHRGRRRSI